MNKFLHHLRTSERGLTALLITVVALVIGVALLLSVAFVFLNRLESSRNIGLSEGAYFAAEAGVEDALLRLLDPGKQLPMSYPYTVSTSNADSDVTIGTDLFGLVTVDAQGDARSRIRSVRVRLGLGTNIGSIAFGAHVGENGLTMNANAIVNGNVFSNSDITGFSNSTINGDAVAVGSVSSPDPTVTGVVTEGVAPIALPFIDANAWKAAANVNNDPITGGYTLNGESVSLGPRRIDGNLTMNASSSLRVTGPLHVTGDLVMESNTKIDLDNSFGSDGTVIIVDGTISFNANAEVEATNASPKGYLMFASTKASGDAIMLNSNSVLEAILYAINADLVINSNGEAVAIIGKGIRLNSNAEINYDLGVASQFFSTGGTASYAIIDWKEQ